jgi:hypothetical protein
MRKLTIIALIILFGFPQYSLSKDNELTFENVYHKAFYRNPWIATGILSAAILTAAVVTTFTAGTGAPAAATGVSSVASWIAGGGAGSYMAGLSVVGSTFGGNAILGAAILNGASALTIGSIAGKGGIAIASKLAIGTLGAGEIAVILTEDKSEILAYSIVIPLPERIGSEQGKQLITSIKNISEMLEDGNISTETYIKLKDGYRKDAIDLFNQYNMEDKVIAVIVLHTLGYIDDFKTYSNALSPTYTANNSFVFYIKSIAALLDGHYNESVSFASYPMIDEPKVLEPILINILAKYNITSKQSFASMMQWFLSDIDKFGEYYYTTPNGKLNAYVLLANLYNNNKNFPEAKKCYMLALDETDWLGDKNRKASLCASLGNVCYCLNQAGEGFEFYKKAIKYADKDVYIKSMFTYGS